MNKAPEPEDDYTEDDDERYPGEARPEEFSPS